MGNSKRIFWSIVKLENWFAAADCDIICWSTPGKFNVLGPVGDIVSEWIIKGAMITEASFGDYNWDTENAAQEITMTVQPDYCVLNF